MEHLFTDLISLSPSQSSAKVDIEMSDRPIFLRFFQKQHLLGCRNELSPGKVQFSQPRWNDAHQISRFQWFCRIHRVWLRSLEKSHFFLSTTETQNDHSEWQLGVRQAQPYNLGGRYDVRILTRYPPIIELEITLWNSIGFFTTITSKPCNSYPRPFTEYMILNQQSRSLTLNQPHHPPPMRC